ncbi:hypothetical protein PMAYCL1PPCAC_19451 [Pristionchus mayeri]|uniref:Uncharacterized protein n=1 Tax=Pristionchus mayeri TaxID=1317129 RepID=A0AAN5CRF2_9BILA|nr:hypothetical protein PMAYCL1PPCAC_19451 [Pristionchus mayeri]
MMNSDLDISNVPSCLHTGSHEYEWRSKIIHGISTTGFSKTTVDHDTFVWLFNCVHSCEWTCITVHKAVGVAAIIERFEMLSLYDKLHSYLISAEIPKEMTTKVVLVADKMPGGSLIIDRVCESFRLEEILSLSRNVVATVSQGTMAALLEATEKSISRPMLMEHKIYVELRERPGVQKTDFLQLTVRFTESCDIWRMLPHKYRYMKFYDLKDKQWSVIKKRGETLEEDKSRIGCILLFLLGK